ncbi:MAG TPA: serine hydrolase domain-containing protein, partial [Longimicrobiales bacterium]|nr:serine hydrolase domain-containing protein [Longimicrobiales bacterium]
MKMNSPVSGLALALAAGLLLAAAPMAAPAQALDPAAQRALDAYVESAMADWGVPGVAIAVVKDDQVVMARGYGEREVGSGEPVDENTVFAIASITKSFTSAAMGMLVEEGRVAWDDPVTEHLSGFQLADPWVTREFTIRDLLSHRAGVERGDWLWFGTDYDRDEVVHHLRYLRPVADFRADYGYSNNMYIAAGQLIAEVTGTNWDDFVTRRIFEPLGMRRSNTTVRALPAMDNVAAPHEELNGALTTVPPGNLDNEGPGGSINSSVAQMAQWIRLMLNGGEVDGRRLLDSATIAEIHSPHVVIPV